MAKIEFKGFEEYQKKYPILSKNLKGIIKYSCYDAAGMVAEAIKANCPVDSGDLRDSVILTDYRDDDGYIYTMVYFEGYDSKGVPNLLKARTLESGRHDKYKHPFVRPAVDHVRKAAVASIEAALNRKLEELMK